MTRLKGVSFETAIIERYRCRESSVEDITEALWRSKVSPATISELNKKAYVHIEDWRNRPLQGGRYPYVSSSATSAWEMVEAVGEVFPDAKYQRCTVHFYRNVFSVVPKSKVKIVAKMLKAIHTQEIPRQG